MALYTQGWLRFKKWGHLDKISDLPENRTAFIDYDSIDDPRLTIPRINSAFRAMGLQSGYSAIRYNRSKRGWHAAIVLRGKVSSIERVAMEAILGDDPMRAAMNFARAKNAKKMPKFWRQRWDILYDYKIEVKP